MKNKAVILAGDLNVCHQDIDIFDTKGKDKLAGFTPQERKSFGDFLQNYNYIDTFRHFYPTEKKFTYWSMRFGGKPSLDKGWRLDYFLINKSSLKIV